MPGQALTMLWWACAVVGALQWQLSRGQCAHEMVNVEPPAPAENLDAGENHTVLGEGRPVFHEISLNMTRLYYYETFNVTTMEQPDKYRKLILSLEPCEGVVYLFVRRTRRCWPNPHSCCQSVSGGTSNSPPCDTASHDINCGWTHFHSVIDGSRDGAPSFFEMPLGSTKYYISVFAPEDKNLQFGVTKPKYRLMALTDIGAYPRVGSQGRLKAKQISDMTLELTWEQTTFVPIGVSDLKNYHIFSSLLLAKEQKSSSAVFLNPSKVMNSACGLERNAVRYGSPLTDAVCNGGTCRATVTGVVPKRRYMLNIVSESHRGFNSTYAGVIVSADWVEATQLLSDNVVGLLGAICGTIFGVVVIGYLWIVKLYR
mmetsp:Transcript_92318/g.214516  ORF Transcript_92318/g.214516 Transcript_92318/m.214516 type:complete len:371 (+) Transcript_92318:38-1150(+)